MAEEASRAPPADVVLVLVVLVVDDEKNDEDDDPARRGTRRWTLLVPNFAIADCRRGGNATNAHVVRHGRDATTRNVASRSNRAVVDEDNDVDDDDDVGVEGIDDESIDMRVATSSSVGRYLLGGGGGDGRPSRRVVGIGRSIGLRWWDVCFFLSVLGFDCVKG